MFDVMTFNWHMMFILTSIEILQAESWYVANKGKDTAKCGNRENPCKNLRTTIRKAAEDDHIHLVAKCKYETFNVCIDKEKPIVIQYSITISGLDFIPQIKCNNTVFIFWIDGTDNNVNVRFVDVAFQRDHFKIHKTCQPTENGIIKVVNANIFVIGCYFKRICTALLVNFNNNEMYSVTIDSTEFDCISYALYSIEIDKAIISIDSMKVIGRADKTCTKSRAILLVSYEHLELKITNSAIKKTNEGISLTIHGGITNVEIDSVIISKNMGHGVIVTFGEGNDRDKSKIFLNNVQFVENTGSFAPAVHLVDEDKQNNAFKVYVYMTECIFYENQADTLYGSIYADGVFLYIENSFFTNNVVGESFVYIQGFGGAIYVEKNTTVSVTNSTFINNTCSGFGGTIFSRGKFACVNCEFTGASDILIRPLLGDILYATAGLTLINTTWKSTAIKDIPRSLIWHPGSPTTEQWDINVSGYFNAICPEGHNISYYGVVHRRRSVSRITMSCKPCPINQYSLTSGTLNVRRKGGVVFESQRTTAHCHRCKYGGVCEKGSIRAQPNYYGYRTGLMGDEVQFIPCPIGYCCQGDSCQKYNSCQKHREGLLCGKCKSGMSENLINSKCVLPRQCKDHWFWIIFLPFGILYILTFMYLDKISVFIKQQLIWWDNKIHHKHDLEEYVILEARDAESESQSPEVESCKIEEISQRKDDIHKKPYDDQGDTEPTRNYYNQYIFQIPGEINRGPDLFTDMLEISFYFYQMFLLIRRPESVVLDNMILCLRFVYSSMFTLSIKLNYSVLLCPIRGLTAVTKLLLENTFACYVLILLFLLHIIVYCVQYSLPQLHSYRKESLIIFSIRLKVATIQVLLLSYSTLSETAVTLISCTPLSKEFVLLIDGTITCYTWWQVLIFLFVLTWVIPFPFVMVYSSIHLKKEYITYHQFVLSWIFPFIYIIWLFCVFKQTKPIYQINEQTEILNEEERLSVNEILFQLECSFVGEANHLKYRTGIDQSNDTEKSNACEIREPVFWQGALILRRLILILFLTFITSPISKYYCALFLCVMYLVHQLYYKPYLITISNLYEMLTSVTLILFCSMNLFFAYSYMSDIPPKAADANLNIIFQWFEAIILVFLPTSFALLLFCLVMTRVFILVLKLFTSILDCLTGIN